MTKDTPVKKRLSGILLHPTSLPGPFGIGDFGGWAKAKKEIVDGVWKGRVLKELGK